MTKLRIAENLSLPLDADTQTFAVLAKRGVGKTYTAAVFAEELLKAGRQVVVVDPIGVWYGLRSSADGKHAGLPIIVMGGDHGDVPLEVTAGSTIADFIIDERASVVLDLSKFRKGEQVRFMTAFAEALYHKNRQPLMLIVDEADAFAPQRPMPGEQQLLGAMEDIVRRGRARGLGVMLVTQRAAVLNKNVLTQIEVLVVLRTIAPQDREAIDAWVKVYGTDEQYETLSASLATLQIGEAWFWSPGWLDVFKRIQVRQRETFDSSATPKSGAVAKQPKERAAVDLEALRVRIAATIEKAKAEDPKELRKQIAELKKQVAQKDAVLAEVDVRTKRIDDKLARVQSKTTAVLTDTDRATLNKVAQRLADVSTLLRGGWLRAIDDAKQAVAEAITECHASIIASTGGYREGFEKTLDAKGFEKILHKLSAVSPPMPPERPAAQLPTHRPLLHKPAGSPGGSRPVARPAVESNGDLGAAEQRVLDALAWWRAAGVNEPTRHQVAFVARYTVNGHFNNTVGGLRTKALVDYPSSGGVSLTEAGDAAANRVDEAPTRAALIDRVSSVLSEAPVRRIFQAVVDADRVVTREELAGLSGYTVNGHFNNCVGSLRSLGVIEYQERGGVKLSELFEALA